MRIGDLAEATGATPRALRHYEAAGLSPQPENPTATATTPPRPSPGSTTSATS
ncbi:MerR family DNA-binding transcriptional regulator [Actinokineospora globicatena]|uniref:MerR family DNA-binding transcriptional regulator n=1 Tax=Actinokineospora globicatena TaxID=103729 RepID=UPI00355909A8